MTDFDDQNVTSENIGFVIDGETFSVNPELLRSYYAQAASHLATMDRANDAFKQEVETFAKTSDLPVTFVTGLFKNTFSGKIEKECQKNAALATLSKALN